jgi:SagB-type dehydrogenase family enzyme
MLNGRKWDAMLMPSEDDVRVWELFHENSKTSLYVRSPSDETVVARLAQMHQSLPYDAYPAIDLPDRLTPLEISLGDAIKNRVTTRSMQPCALTLEMVGTLLFCAYGVTRDNQNTAFSGPFRTVPSAGALYPLELYFHSAHVDGLPPGLYHYNPSLNNLQCLRQQDQSAHLAKALLQSNIASDAALTVFITALFERTTFKYGERGYRFLLLEAGHVAQNINLVAIALGLGCISVGGYFDREIDDMLGLDGLTHSTIYMLAIGAAGLDSQSAS